MRPKVAIIGPYTMGGLGVLMNIVKGVEAAAELMDRGFAPLCAWLDWQYLHHREMPKEYFLESYREWIAVADYCLALPGWEDSGGSLGDLATAKKFGIPVFYTIDSLEAYHRSLQKQEVTCDML